MSTVTKSLIITEPGTYDLSIRIFKATINVSTSSSVLYNQPLIVISKDGKTYSSAFDSSGHASIVVNDPGQYEIACTYAGVTNTATVNVDEETTYSATLVRWAATVKIITKSTQWFGEDVTITSLTDGSVYHATFVQSGTSAVATYLTGHQDNLEISMTDNLGIEHTQTVNVKSQTTYNVTLTATEIKPWATATWEEIYLLIDALDKGILTTEQLGWEVGDERVESMPSLEAGTDHVAHAAQDIILVIVGVGDECSRDGNHCNYVIAFKNCIKEAEKVETSNTNQNGWTYSRGRYCCDDIWTFWLSSTYTNKTFKDMYITTASKGGSDSSGVDTNRPACKLSLFSEMDVFGTHEKSTNDEYIALWNKGIRQLDYFAIAANRKKFTTGTSAKSWALRSPAKANTTGFCYVTTAGAIAQGTASTARYFAPFGQI